MADFREVISVSRGAHGLFIYSHVQIDLVDLSVKTFRQGFQASAREIACVLWDFAPSIEEARRYLRAFFEHGEITVSDEY